MISVNISKLGCASNSRDLSDSATPTCTLGIPISIAIEGVSPSGVLRSLLALLITQPDRNTRKERKATQGNARQAIPTRQKQHQQTVCLANRMCVLVKFVGGPGLLPVGCMPASCSPACLLSLVWWSLRSLASGLQAIAGIDNHAEHSLVHMPKRTELLLYEGLPYHLACRVDMSKGGMCV